MFVISFMLEKRKIHTTTHKEFPSIDIRLPWNEERFSLIIRDTHMSIAFKMYKKTLEIELASPPGEHRGISLNHAIILALYVSTHRDEDVLENYLSIYYSRKLRSFEES